MDGCFEKGSIRLFNNLDILSQVFPQSNPELLLSCSALLCIYRKDADQEVLLRCRSIASSHGVRPPFFRNYEEVPLVTRMSIARDPLAYDLHVTSIYRSMSGWQNLPPFFRFMTAVIILDAGGESSALYYNQRTYEVAGYLHQPLDIKTIVHDAVPFAAMLVVTGRDPVVFKQEALACRSLIGSQIQDEHIALVLCSILVLHSGNGSKLVKKALRLLSLLRQSGEPISNYYDMILMGLLVHLPLTPEETMEALKKSYLQIASLEKERGLLKKLPMYRYAAIVMMTAFLSDEKSDTEDDLAYPMKSCLMIAAVSMIERMSEDEK